MIRAGLSCLVGLAALGIAGCATPDRLALPPEPVAVAARAGAVPLAREHREIIVRAFVEGGDGALREVGGAECRLATYAFEARFRSPGRVVVPVLFDAPPLEVRCATDGRAGFARASLVRRSSYPYGRPWDPWRRDPFDRWSGAWGFSGDRYWGPWGPEQYQVFYPDIRVRMR